MFPDLRENYNTHRRLCERAISATKNDIAIHINKFIQEMLAGNSITYAEICHLSENLLTGPSNEEEGHCLFKIS